MSITAVSLTTPKQPTKKHHKKGLEIDENTRDSNLWGFRPKDI